MPVRTGSAGRDETLGDADFAGTIFVAITGFRRKRDASPSPFASAVLLALLSNPDSAPHSANYKTQKSGGSPQL